MLANDASYWCPQSLAEAAQLAWGSCQGDFAVLKRQAQLNWAQLQSDVLGHIHPHVSAGKTVEFGAGLGLLDELIGPECNELLMLDSSDAFLKQRPTPLSSRCQFLAFNRENADRLLKDCSNHFDFALSLNVFYHVDTLAALALVRFMAALTKVGGYILIYGFNCHNVTNARDTGLEVLFSSYPNYLVDPLILQKALAPACEEVFRSASVLIYKRTSMPAFP